VGAGSGGALAWKGPSISSGGAPVIFQAMRMPTKMITKPRRPETPSVSSRKGEARPAKRSAPAAEVRLGVDLWPLARGSSWGDAEPGSVAMDADEESGA